VHCIKLAAFLDLLLDETAAIPERTLKQDGQVLHFVPGEEFLTESIRRPQTDVKQPVAAFAAMVTAREQHLQLFNDGKRWYVVSIFWDEERADNPLPQKYLTK